jgi:glucose/mannose transport system substrate-binding protein
MAHGHANPAAVKNAIYDVVTREFNGDLSSDDAVKELASAVAAAK